MILNSTEEYLSIPIIKDLELPDFVVLTGKNGSGKTHFLQAVINKKISLNQSTSFTSILINDFNTVKNKVEPKLNRHEDDGTGRIVGDLTNTYNRLMPDRKKIENAFDHMHMLDRFNSYLAQTNKDFNSLTLDDFQSIGKKNNSFYSLPNALFQNTVESRFIEYAKKYFENEFKSFRNKKGNKKIVFLTEKQFIEDYGNPPWDEINRILAETKLPYKFNQPIDISEHGNFRLKLLSKDSDLEIDVDFLSSGENVILSLCIALFNSKIKHQFPAILLLDEPDAYLHPSLTKDFLDVIQKTFVEKMQIKVIMTTHSPSTVAMVPESSLYVMNKEGKRIQKTTKDKAIGILTEGIPSLSINYENRRQIFVESPYDQEIYESIYQRIKRQLYLEISLSFISSGSSKLDKNGDPINNCEQVKKITKTLRDAGNKQVYGIIDWDGGKNNGNEGVKISGLNTRHTLENYILDPLLLGAFILREKIRKKNS